MNVRKLQQQAAAGADELLRISNDMDQYIIPLYKTVPKEIFDMQCRIMIGRCEGLGKKLRQIQTDLANAKQRMQTEETVTRQRQSDFADPVDVLADVRMEETRKSIVLTEQIISQNLLLLEQKQDLLNGFLAHSDEIHVHLKASEQMQDIAEVTRLESTLRRELHLCRTENKK